MWDVGMSSGYKPEKYKDYRNRTVKKYTENFETLLQRIKQCSLKGEDKEKLRQQFMKRLNENL